MTHTPEPWRVARGGSVVSDVPFGASDVDAYDAYQGGFMVCESASPDNARRIAACVNACRGLSLHDLEAGLVGRAFAALDGMVAELGAARFWSKERVSEWDVHRTDSILTASRSILNRAHGRCVALVKVP